MEMKRICLRGLEDLLSKKELKNVLGGSGSGESGSTFYITCYYGSANPLMYYQTSSFESALDVCENYGQIECYVYNNCQSCGIPIRICGGYSPVLE